MFVYSFRASTARFLSVVALALVTLILLVIFVPTYAATETGGATYTYSKIRTEEDRRAFLSQFGWEVAGEAVETREVTVPSEFDKVFAAYNELQKEQGFDLSRFRKKTLTRYTYEVTGFPADFPAYDGTVYVHLLVYRNRVVGADVASADVSGFICGLEGR